MSPAPRGSPWLPARRAALHAALLCASSAPLRAVEDGASCVADVAADDAIVADTAEFLPEKERTRLVRILRTGEQQTGVKLRVLTRSRASDDWTYDPRAIRCRLGLEAARGNQILMVADRGIPGALEAGSAFLSFQVGQNVLLNLPEFYFGRLVQEYGRRSFVEARGEAASIVNAVELILTCLRSEEGFCTSVPPASSAPLL